MHKPLAILAMAAALLVSPAALSHSHKKKNLEIGHPYTMASVDRSTTTAKVFMTIKNSDGSPERLLSASTSRAAKVELAVADGATRDTAFTIRPGTTLVLGPKGGHLVLAGVKKALTAYDEFKMTLVFEKSGRMVVDVVVEEASIEEPQKH